VPLVRSGRPCGAITLERAQPFEEATVMLLEVVAALAGPMLDDRRRDDRFVGGKIVDALYGFAERLFGPRHVGLKLAVFGISGVVLLLSIARGDFRVTADTVVEPAVKRAAVSPFEGFIATAPARPGDVVTEGQVLGTLDDRELKLERAKWESQYSQALKEYRHALADRDAAGVEIRAAAVEEARAQLDLIRDRLARTELRAPFDGVVVLGDLSQRLGAPIKKGEVLFEVAPLEAYRLYLKVDESDVTHVQEGHEGSLVLKALPQDSFRFTVEKITPVSSADEGKNSFRVEARLHGDPALLHPGEGGIAKIEVGERRLIWIWTHDLWDWARLKIWAWTP
jgi:RND family efflux transporter MFP subunit